MVENSIKAIELYNEKAQKLLRSSILTKLQDGKINLSITMDGGLINDPTVVLPDEEFIEAFLLTLRFFIQDNEPSSIRNLYDIYNLKSRVNL